MYLLQSSPKELNSDVGLKLKGEIERRLKYNKNKGVTYLMGIQQAAQAQEVATA